MIKYKLYCDHVEMDQKVWFVKTKDTTLGFDSCEKAIKWIIKEQSK